MSFRGKSTYPYVRKEDWCTRGWLLVRKVRRQSASTDYDRRVAMLLLERQPSGWGVLELRVELEDIAYG